MMGGREPDNGEDPLAALGSDGEQELKRKRGLDELWKWALFFGILALLEYGTRHL